MGPEAKIEKHFTTRVKSYGALPFKFVSPGYNGVTDRIVLLPDGKVVFVEIKAPGGKLSALQEAFARRIAVCKAEYFVVWCEADIDKFIDKYFWHLL